jgi:type VI secretion system protein ImpA
VLAVAEVAFSTALDDDGTTEMPVAAPEISSSAMTDSGSAGGKLLLVDSSIPAPPQPGMAEQLVTIDPAVAALCTPLSQADPCGPDLDLAGDPDYLNFFAKTEGVLPSSFFSSDDGKPFDRSNVDLPGCVEAMLPLWERSRDLRLLVMRARLVILNRDLGGFAVAIAAIAHWLDEFWEHVHPRAADGDFGARAAALGALDLPTVVFPLQYAPLCEGRRIGAVTYRAWMVASGDVKPRPGEQKYPSGAIIQAMADASLDALAATRAHVAMIKTSLGRIREAFTRQGSSVGLEGLTALVVKMQGLVDPRAVQKETAASTAKAGDAQAADSSSAAGVAVDAPGSLAQAQQALAAIAGYYSRSEPSSPILPLVRQAHQLIGKSFFEVMSILVPSQMEKAAFQIGADQFFELPVGKLSKLSEASPPTDGAGQATHPAPSAGGDFLPYRVDSRGQAIALLDQVQRFFRHSEPSSPVPMLCDRARALAERDFMGVLREVLPKAALKNVGAEK